MKTMGRKPKKRTTPLGKRLLAIRERLNLTQEEAAEKVCVSLNAWFAWEIGKVTPTRGNLKLISLLEQGKI
jgi:transcriptional regulator with XRE-family HTH domain